MILSSHGGRVWAENSDFGPRFSFVLPWRAAQTAAAAAREETVGRLGTSGFATRATVPTT